MYHYIRHDNNSYPFSKHKNINDFENECKFIKSNFCSKNVSDALVNEEFNQKTILLTFDDGFKDHLDAAEILKKYDLKGTFYITINPYLERDILPVHKAHLIISKYGGESLSLLERATKKLNLNEYIYKNYQEKETYKNAYSQHSDHTSIKEFKKIINYYGDLGLRKLILDEILFETEIESDPKKFYLSIDEIKYLSSLGFEIGSHGCSHTVLSRLNKNEQFKEINNSKEFIEMVISRKVNSFCYPYGRKMSYNNETIKILKKLNFKSAVAVESREIKKEDLIKNTYEIPRFDCNQVNQLFKDFNK